jgi:guanylate cyclase
VANVAPIQGQQSPKNASISLFDIFPEHVAEALRNGQNVEPEHRNVVTIFFSDTVGFADISSALEPRKIVNMLDHLCSKFDNLSHKHGAFKVETIGETCAGMTNLVQDQPDVHVKRIADFAVSNQSCRKHDHRPL